MANSTTFGAIRAAYIRVIEALTPTVLQREENKYRRCPDKRIPVKDWALTHGADNCFRRFDFHTDGPVSDQGIVANPNQRNQMALITIAYPVTPALYGPDDVDSMEDVIAADAAQIRDAVFDPANLLDGHIAMLVTINDVDRTDERVWFSTLAVEVIFYHAQSLQAVVDEEPEPEPATGSTIVDLTVDDAFLANGAQVKVAASGMPRRVTTEDEYQFDVALDSSAICFAANDRDIWTAQSNLIRKYSFAGTLITSKAATSAWSLIRQDADHLLIGRISTSAYYNYTESTDTLTSRTTSSTVRIVVPGPTGSGLAWYSPLGTVQVEVTEATGASTGRTITTATNSSMWSSEADGTWGLYVNTANTVTKYEDVAGTMTAVKTWTSLTGSSPNPGATSGSEMIIDPTGRPIIKTGSGHIDRWNLSGGAQLGVAERVVWPNADIAGPVAFTPGGGNQSLPAVCYSQDGRYFAMLMASIDSTSYDKGVRVKNLLTQRATWTYTSTDTFTLENIVVPGQLANEYGVTTAWRAGTQIDFRRTRLYYQRDAGGGGTADVARVEFTPGDDLAVDLVAGQTITIDADFNMGLGMLNTGAYPWIGTSSGVAVRLILTPPV